MARKNPTLTTSSAKLKRVAGGLEIPIVSGTNMEVQEEGNAMPDVNMTKNDGSNPSIPDAPFANGKDIRSYGSSPSSNCAPGMPGANCN